MSWHDMEWHWMGQKRNHYQYLKTFYNDVISSWHESSSNLINSIDVYEAITVQYGFEVSTTSLLDSEWNSVAWEVQREFFEEKVW